MGKINTTNYPNRPVSDYQDDDMFVLQDNGGETYTTNVGDIKDLIGEETDPKLALKVDKNGTDRLMTAAEGTKLAGIAAGAQVNVLEGVQVNGTDLPITNKKVNVDISGKTDLKVIAFPFHDPVEGEPQMTFLKGAYVTYNGKLYEFTEEHTGAWNPSHVREIDVSRMYVRAGNGGYNNGDSATCEGYNTKASGDYSHAEGRETQAVGDYTHAEGRGTVANSVYQHVEGKYNIADDESKYIHIIGNGIDANNRSNAFTVDWEGNLEVSGEVEDGNGEKISDKADKVTNATSGHLAGLDSNGNLTDSGVSPTEDVTVEGNSVTFESPFEQDAKSVVVTAKPIQDLHGYDHPWAGGAGKNKLPLVLADIKAINVNGTWEGNTYIYNGLRCTVITDSAGNVTKFEVLGTPETALYIHLCRSQAWSQGQIITGYVSGGSNNTFGIGLEGTGDWAYYERKTITSNIEAIVGIWYGTAAGAVNHSWYPMIVNAGETDFSFAPYSNECPISGIDEVEIGVSDGESEPTTTTIPLPSTLYDGDVDVTEGSAVDGYGFKVLSSASDWHVSTNPYVPSGRYVYYINTVLANSKPAINDNNSGNVHMKSNIFDIGTYAYNSMVLETTFSIGIGGTNNGSVIGINTDIDNLQDFKSWVDSVGIQIMYELATPTTLSLTPTDVELLEGTNVVTTNGEKVAVTFGRSLWQDINELKTDTEGKLDKSDVADVEGDTASRAYSVNEFMLRSDGLYKVTQPIAQNASITSSNTTKTTIGAVLTALLNA